jgi:ribonucleoside-diphosphate reductase alpha chain
LGSLNLATFIAGHDLDWSRLAGAIHDAVVFLDNVVEANHYPFAEIASATQRTRKIGLGVMGLAEMFARIAVAYDSEQALTLAQKIAKFISAEARAASVKLGAARGSFPAFRDSVWLERGFTALRNAAATCVAPTGTISVIANTSSSIEPFYALAFARRVLDNRQIIEVNPLVETELKKLGRQGKAALQAVKAQGSLRQLADLPEALGRRFPIALEIAPESHVRMQAAFQAHIDAAVSKTVNLPEAATVETVRNIFTLAHDLHLKGITIYRYGTKAEQTLSLIGDRSRSDCRECAV